MPSIAAIREAHCVLAHLVVQAAADRAGARVICLKGKSLSFHQLRVERASADVDVLVEVSRSEALLGELDRLGWSPRPASWGYSETIRHATTLSHPDWSCDIDMHLSFPGMLASPQAIFEVLWTERESMPVGGGRIAVPSRPASAVIMALHGIRSAGTDRARWDEVASLANALSEDAALREAVRASASALGAHAALARVLPDYFDAPEHLDRPERAELRSWVRRTEGGSSATAYGWDLLSRTPFLRKPGVFLRLIWPTDYDLRVEDPGLAPGSRAVFRARLRRLWRGVRALPRAVRAGSSS